MRSTLFALGAFLFLGYPLFLLFAIAGTLDQSQRKPESAAIMLTARSANQSLERDSGSSEVAIRFRSKSPTETAVR